MQSEHQHYSVTEENLSSIPLIGALLKVMYDPLGSSIKTCHEGGDIITFDIMGVKGVHINHPDLVQYVLQGNNKNYEKSRHYIRFESAIGLGLLTSNGDKWRRDRQTIQPMFKRERISGYYFDVVNEVAEKYKQRWLQETSGNAEMILDVSQEMARITTEVILKSVFGKDIKDETVVLLHGAYGVLIDYLKNVRVFPKVDSRKLFCAPSYFRFKKALQIVDENIARLTKHYQGKGFEDQYNTLALLVKAQESDPEHFTDKDIRDHCVSMVFAGFESTSVLMQWLWYVLDERRDVVEKLRAELADKVPITSSHDSSALSFDDMQSAQYLSMVYKETMRLYPPFWLTARESLGDDYLGDYKISKGSNVVLHQFAMHRHPRWWDHPNSFIPERFSPQNEPKIHEGAYFPFSLGPRKCSGHTFVDMEAKTIIAKLLPLFDVVALNKIGNAISPGISLKLKHSLIVRIRRASLAN